MPALRQTLFWLHLAAGLLAGLFIAIMAFTGALLAFEPELLRWAERDLRHATPPAAGATTLPLDDLVARAREAATATTAARNAVTTSSSVPTAPAAPHPSSTPAATPLPRIAGVTVSAAPRTAVAVNFGRDLGVYYVNPYTGEVRPPGPTRLHDFLHLMEDWHRYLALEGDHRPLGKAITGAANTAFLFLALSGLWLWWPRQWSARVLRPSLWFLRGATGRSRDWNWHNVLGFWSLPFLVVLTATGLVISYRWASDLAFRAAGEAPPPAAAPAADFNIERPPGTSRLTYAAILHRLQSDHPHWTEITLREGLPARRGAPSANPTPQPAANPTPSPAPASSAAAPAPAVNTPRPRGPQPFSATLHADDGAPRFAATQLVLHPFTGDTLQRTGYADLSPGRKVRLWLRHLHTGYALGLPGQLAACLASLAACVLVWTGFALTWRRFSRRARPSRASA